MTGMCPIPQLLNLPVVLLGLPLEPDLVALLLAVLLHVLLGALEHLLPLGVRGLEMMMALNVKLLRQVRGDIRSCIRVNYNI